MTWARIAVCVIAVTVVLAHAAAAQTPLKVTYYPVRDNKLPLWVAQDAGLFRQNGLDVTLVSEAKRGETTIAALLAGETDVAVLGFRDAVQPMIKAGRTDLVVIAGLAPNPFIFIARPEIRTAQDLKGKKVWTAGFGHGPDVSTRVVLRYLGLDPERDVELVPCEDCPATLLGKHVTGHNVGVSQLLEGKVAASLSSRSTLADLKRAGENVTLLVDFIDAGLTITAADVIARRDWLAANREVAKRLLLSLVQATQYAKQNRAFTEGILSKNLLSELATGRDSKFDDYVLGVLPSRPYPSKVAVELALAEKGKADPAIRAANPEQFVDPSLMRELESEGLLPK